MVLGGIEAFKSMKNVTMWTLYNGPNITFLSDNFFVSASQHGVRTIEFDSSFTDGIRVDIGDALSFGFAERELAVIAVCSESPARSEPTSWSRSKRYGYQTI